MNMKLNSRLHKTSSRKKDHVLLTVKKDVKFKEKTNHFEKWEFCHNALPEINFSEIDTTTVFLHKELSFPFLISCMTGGYKEAKLINRQLAEVCEEKKIALGVGSQRQALENSDYHFSFSIVRKAAPTIPIIGNIGASEVAQLRDTSSIQKLADMIQANAFAIHLNPLQELIQPEGSTNFRGVLNGIEKLVNKLSIPVIVKEIGAGISFNVAKKLADVGVTYIDVAGAGGTSWAGVEILRKNKSSWQEIFWDWGIPTADSLTQVSELKKEFPSLQIISSGGITNGIEIAKSVAMSADVVGSARPLLQQLINYGKKGLDQLINDWHSQLKGAMFLVGALTIDELQHTAIQKVS